MRSAVKFVLMVIFFLIVGYGGYRVYRHFSYTPPPAPAGRQEKTITILEGWNLRDIAVYLEAQGLTSQKDFFAFAGTPTKFGHAGYRSTTLINDFPFLLEIPEGGTLEGYLFPDTYRVYADATVEDIVRKMLANFDAKVTPQMHAEIKAQHRTLFQEITMASIIEREVATDADRPKVADILWSRLAIGMALQVDSSVNYVTGKGVAAISNKDRGVNSPYNTYKFKGLPAGPISNPGIKSILAAIAPAKTPYAYFLTDKQGNVHYAAGLDEHNANKAKYLR